MAQSNEEWLEEDLCKVSYKELKKIAIQRNINPKLRKAQLVTALLTTENTICDKTDVTHVNVTGRVTRSRAALRPLNTMDESACPKSDGNEFNILSSTGNNEEVTTQRKGRKKRTPTTIVNCFEDKVLEEQAANKESLNNYVKSTDPHISGFENKEETKEGIQNCCNIIIKQRESSRTINETEIMPVSTLLRSSTFVLDDQESSRTINETKIMPVSTLLRSSTFVLDDQDGENMETPCSNLMRSNTFTISDKDLEDKSISKTVSKEKKSIGERICLSSKKMSTENKKKIIGSLLKNNSGVVRKAPNFKAIHKRLFDNMESLCDNKERQVARAASLMQSPVPQCSLLTPRSRLMKKLSKANPILKTAIPIKIHGPATVQPVAKASTPATHSKHSNALNSASTKNFGVYRRRSSSGLDRQRAKAAICTKLPPVNLEQRNEDRAYIQGVRMNKRFLLQMEMRRSKK